MEIIAIKFDFQIDDNYVGEPPKVEVTIENLNDNVDKQFLHHMVNKFGVVEEMIIYFHPLTKKHLGLARLVFEQVRGAKDCVKNLHGKPVMGKQLNCYLDPYAASCKKMFQEMTEEKRPEPPPPPPEESPPEMEMPENDRMQQSPNWEKKESGRTYGSSSLDRSNGDGRGRGDYGSRRDKRRSDHRDSRDSGDYSRGRDWRHRQDLDRRHSRDNNESRSEFLPDYEEYENEQAPPAQSSNASMSYPSEHKNEENQPAFHSGQFGATGFTDADYWMQRAQQYASQGQALAQKIAAESEQLGEEAAVNPEDQQQEGSVKGSEDEAPEEGEAEEEGNDHNMDLDTRLKMLMKDRSGAMPAFLLEELNQSESDGEAKEDHDGEKTVPSDMFPLLPDEVPLSRAPSPFLSADHYLRSHKEWVAERRGHREGKATKKQKNRSRRPNSRNSDQMSLSSLSSGENNILQQGPAEGDNGMTYPPPGYGYYASAFPGGVWAEDGTYHPPEAYMMHQGHYDHMSYPHYGGTMEGYYDQQYVMDAHGNYRYIGEDNHLDNQTNVRPLIQ